MKNVLTIATGKRKFRRRKFRRPEISSPAESYVAGIWDTANYFFVNKIVVYTRAETNIRNVTNEPFSKRTNIRIFVRFDE